MGAKQPLRLTRNGRSHCFGTARATPVNGVVKPLLVRLKFPAEVVTFPCTLTQGIRKQRLVDLRLAAPPPTLKPLSLNEKVAYVATPAPRKKRVSPFSAVVRASATVEAASFVIISPVILASFIALAAPALPEGSAAVN